MDSQNKIPEPSDSGSDGSQVKSEGETLFIEAKPLVGLPMVQTIEGLAASNTRAFGNEVTSALIVGATSQLASELQYSKKEIAALQNKNDKLKDDLSSSNQRKAVLEERIRSYRTNRHLRNLGLTVGTALVGMGFKFIEMNLEKYAYAAFCLGGLFIVLCWFSMPEGADK